MPAPGYLKTKQRNTLPTAFRLYGNTYFQVAFPGLNPFE